MKRKDVGGQAVIEGVMMRGSERLMENLFFQEIK